MISPAIRNIIKMNIIKGFFVLVFTLLTAGCTDSETKILRQADNIHLSALTVDTHCDTPMNLMKPDFDLGKKQETGSVDFPRMKEGGLHAEFFVVFIGQGPRNDSSYANAHRRALDIFKAIHENVKKNSDMAEIALSAEDAYNIKKKGKIAAFIGLENGYPAGKDLSKIKQYYDLGARYITLCHSKNNDICDSSTDPAGPEHNGLSDFGAEVVREMNRNGILIDVSHISDEAFYDVLKVTKVPVIASHSSCRALCENPRNLSDDMLLALKENSGVIQICLLSNYLKPSEPNPELDSVLNSIRSKYRNPETLDDQRKKQLRDEFLAAQWKYEKLATVKDVVNHIDHVVQVIGIDHVGIGTDFDGGGRVEGCKTAAEVKNITIELLRRGYRKRDIEKIWGGNIMRVLRQAKEFAGKNKI